MQYAWQHLDDLHHAIACFFLSEIWSFLSCHVIFNSFYHYNFVYCSFNYVFWNKNVEFMVIISKIPDYRFQSMERKLMNDSIRLQSKRMRVDWCYYSYWVVDLIKTLRSNFLFVCDHAFSILFIYSVIYAIAKRCQLFFKILIAYRMNNEFFN